MRRHLSTRAFANQRLTVALLDRIHRSGVEQVEIFCARQHLDYRNRGQVDEIRHWLRDAELNLLALHAPLFSDDVWGRSGPQSHLVITAREKAERIRAADEIKRALEVADAIPFRFFILPLGKPEEEYDPAGVEAAFNTLEEIHVMARQLGADVLIENVANRMGDAERLQLFLTTTHLPLNLSFSTGAAEKTGDLADEFERMKERIRSVHLHDIDGSRDGRYFPTLAERGRIDWPRTVELLRSLDESIPWILDPGPAEEPAVGLQRASEAFDQLEKL